MHRHVILSTDNPGRVVPLPGGLSAAPSSPTARRDKEIGDGMRGAFDTVVLILLCVRGRFFSPVFRYFCTL